MHQHFQLPLPLPKNCGTPVQDSRESPLLSLLATEVSGFALAVSLLPCVTYHRPKAMRATDEPTCESKSTFLLPSLRCGVVVREGRVGNTFSVSSAISPFMLHFHSTFFKKREAEIHPCLGMLVQQHKVSSSTLSMLPRQVKGLAVWLLGSWGI